MSLKLRDVKDRMDTPKLLRKPKCIGHGTGFGDDFIRSEVLLGELRSWTSGSDMLCQDEGRISDVKGRTGVASPIGRVLVSELSGGDLLSEEFVKTLKVDGHVFSVSVSHITLRMNG